MLNSYSTLHMLVNVGIFDLFLLIYRILLAHSVKQSRPHVEAVSQKLQRGRKRMTTYGNKILNFHKDSK